MPDEIIALADRFNVSPGRVLISEKEGHRVCAVCDEPVIRANYTAHLDFRKKNHDAKTAAI